MNNGVYALPGFMAPAAKNWKSQLLTNEDGSVKLCVYVGKPGTKVYYSLGIPGWNWGFIKDAQYFIDKGYPQEVIDEVSKFADYLEEEVTELPEGTVVPDIVINGWPVPITESPIEGKVYWILNIPKFILPVGDTEVQISANGKLIKYTITRPYFSIHYNIPECTTSADTPEGDDEIEEEDCEPKGDYLLFNADRSVRGGRLENVTNLSYLCYGIRYEEWNIPVPSLKNANYMFNLSGVKKINTSLSSVEEGNYMLSYCNLTSWVEPMPFLKTAQYFLLRNYQLISVDFYAPEATDTAGLCENCNRLEQMRVFAPKSATFRDGAAYCYPLEVFEGDLSGVTNLAGGFKGDSNLRVVNTSFPKLSNGDTAFHNCILNKESVLRICNSIPTWSSGDHNITLGIHVDHKYDDEVLAAIALIDKAQTPVANGGKGWTVVIQWNGTASTASASTYNLRGRRDPIYAKRGEDSDGKPYLDWGHYVTDWEENGYMEFASLEEAKEHFNIADSK
jgi:hypothetical protein